jgi:hypothetical protein
MAQETPKEKQLRIARLNLVNAQAAVADLPTVEERALARVADADARLLAAEAELTHVRAVEMPAVYARVAELETEIATLESEE